jgi:hypothetical protein
MKKSLCALLLAACGSSSGGNHIDAAPGTPDAKPSADAPTTGMVNVTVIEGSLPVAGADVVFNDPDGTPTAHVTTDGAGKASGIGHLGGSVTVITVGYSGGVADYYLQTRMGIVPGDDLVIGGEAHPSPYQQPLGYATVHLTPYAGAASYYIESGCDHKNQTTTADASLTLNANCFNSSSTFDVVVTAFDASSKPIAFTTLANQIPPSGGATVDATMPAWRTDFGQLAVQIDNVPPRTSMVEYYVDMKDGFADLFSGGATPTVAPGASTSFMVPFIPTVVSRTSVHAIITEMNATGPAGTLQLIEEQPSLLTSDTIDGAAVKLAQIHDVVVDVPAGQTTPRFTWAADGDNSGAQALELYARWNLLPTMPVGWEWDVMAPPGTPSPVQLPQLPDDLSMHRMTPGQVFSSPLLVTVHTNDAFSGWDEWRGHAGKLVFTGFRHFTSDAVIY